MFSKHDKETNAPSPIASPAVSKTAPSLLGADITIRGDVEAKGEVQIDGTIDGDVDCSQLIVGERANINGAIKADAVLVRGKVVGKIEAKQVELMRSARVQGDIWHETMSIEAGAYLDGMCKRIDQKPASADDAKPIEQLTKSVKTEESSDSPDDAAADENVPPYNPKRGPRSATFGSGKKQASTLSGND